MLAGHDKCINTPQTQKKNYPVSHNDNVGIESYITPLRTQKKDLMTPIHNDNTSTSKSHTVGTKVLFIWL